jgi:hypothetical protein
VEKINVTGKAIPKNESSGTIWKLGTDQQICLLEFILVFSVNLLVNVNAFYLCV